MNTVTPSTATLPADFDPQWYRATYADVDQTGLSPQEHFLHFGAAMGRSPSSAHLKAKRAGMMAQGQQGAGSGYPDSDRIPAKFTVGRTAQPFTAAPGTDASAAAAAALLAGSPIIAPPADLAQGLYDSLTSAPSDRRFAGDTTRVFCGDLEIARIGTERDIPAIIGPLQLYCRLMGLDIGTTLQLVRKGVNCPFPAIPAADALSPLCAGPALRDGVMGLDDAWYLTNGSIRLRPGIALPEIDGQPGVTLRVWQAPAAQPGQLCPAGGAVLAATGPRFCDVTLDNPLMPVLLELSDQSGTTIGLALLPFPTLLRGGLHAAELAACLPMGDAMRAFWNLSAGFLRETLGQGFGQDVVVPPRAITALQVDLGGALGTEPLFSSDMQDWLAAVFGLRVMARPEHAADPADIGGSYLVDMLAKGEALHPELAAGTAASLAMAGTTGLTLILPADSIPTLAALVSRRLTLQGRATMAGPFVIADVVNRRPRWSVAFPVTAAAFLPDLQPASGVMGCPVLTVSGQKPMTESDAKSDTESETVSGKAPAASPLAPVHLSIALRGDPTTHEADLMMPVAPDSDAPILRCMATGSIPAGSISTGGKAAVAGMPPVTLVLRVTDPDRALRFLAGLAGQTGQSSQTGQIGGATDVIVWMAGDDRIALRNQLREGIAARFPSQGPGDAFGRIDVLSPQQAPLVDNGPDLDRFAAMARHDLILFAADTTLLHDTRTLATLDAMLAADPGIASASCLLLHEPVFKKQTLLQTASGGVFPSHVSLMAAPQLVFAEPDCLRALPNATYPVVANVFDLALIRKAAIHATAARRAAFRSGSAADIRFGLDAMAEGWHHLCTTAVRAGTQSRTAGKRDEMDPVGLSYVQPQRWDDILSRVTILREIS